MLIVKTQNIAGVVRPVCVVAFVRNMPFGIRVKRCQLFTLLIFSLVLSVECYEKTLRKIVRDQSKMVQRPFSENSADVRWGKNSQSFPYPGYAQVTSVLHMMQRPKISTILSSIDTGRSKSTFSRMNIPKKEHLGSNDLRMARDSFTNFILPDWHDPAAQDLHNLSNPENTQAKSSYAIPTSRFFPPVEEITSGSKDNDATSKDNNSIIASESSTNNDNTSSFVNSIFIFSTDTPDSVEAAVNVQTHNSTISEYYEVDSNTDNLLSDEELSSLNFYDNNSLSMKLFVPPCTLFYEAKVDIDAQEMFSQFDIEPPWTAKKHFWNHIYESRYESLMRDPKWPSLKAILVPRSQVESVWHQPFENLHNETVRRILSNIVKKLQFYPNMTFSWNEVSHLSHWWEGARQKSRKALRRLIEEGRLEITTGMWVQTDEATSHLFGILHQLIEGHQWLRFNLNYSPEVAWLTDSVTHSPTLPYLLSASGISNLVLTNLHFSWQRFLTEYQYTDFIWVQNWDTDKTANTSLNEVLNRIGNSRYPKYSMVVHYLQFNADDYKACGPQGDICNTEFNFSDLNNNQDINTFNVKEKSEQLLEQYSKTGTTSSHNVIVIPIGGSYKYKSQAEFDLQYNNYQKIIDFVNLNQEIYKASIEFGTIKKYFENILSARRTFPTVKGDFLNYADITDAKAAYWTGFFTTRPTFKILLRRLHSTMRTTEILLSFALNHNALKVTSFNVSQLYDRLLDARKTVALLQDRNVVTGTLTKRALKYALNVILKTAKDCWYIQEAAATLLSSKSAQNEPYLEKYVYREGEFISSFKSVTPGDQIYIFNSMNHERTEIIELITRYPNVKVIDHVNKEVLMQINPVWKSTYEQGIKMTSHFYKIIFIVTIPPMTLQLFKVKDNQEGTPTAATIYCIVCSVDEIDTGLVFPFNIRPIETGDIQLESFKYRLIFDEYTGFLKSVTERSTNNEKNVLIEFGAFKSSHIHSGMFLFNTNVSNPIQDILSPYRLGSKSKAIIIISGPITTELTSIYGNLLQHTVKIFNLVNNPLSEIIKFETNIDYEESPKNRELEIFLSIQTDIDNGNPPELFIDNNGFQWTCHKINTSRRVESNIYPFTTMAYLQDQRSRITIITESAQGITAMQEGQMVVMLDRRVLYDDNRGSNEGIDDNSAMRYTHYLLLENFREPKDNDDLITYSSNYKYPSQLAIYLSNSLDYLLDVFFIDINKTHLCQYAFLPLIKTAFPCEVMLINYRIVLNKGTPVKYSPKNALMTLLKRRFCCLINLRINLHCNENRAFRLSSLIRNLKSVYLTNLVGTNEGVEINYLHNNNFPTMELKTLRLYFN